MMEHAFENQFFSNLKYKEKAQTGIHYTSYTSQYFPYCVHQMCFSQDRYKDSWEKDCVKWQMKSHYCIKYSEPNWKWSLNVNVSCVCIKHPASWLTHFIDCRIEPSSGTYFFSGIDTCIPNTFLFFCVQIVISHLFSRHLDFQIDVIGLVIVGLIGRAHGWQ